MSKEWLWWLGEFGLAAIVAVVAGFVTKDVPISILYGLFVGTVFFVLRQQTRIASQHERQVSEMEDKALNLPTTIRHREDIDPFLKQLVRSSRDETLRLSKEVETGEVTLKTRPLSLIAMDCIKQARPGDKLITLNYGGIWGTERGDVYRQASFDVADKGVDFTRVFVESTSATPEQKKHLREEMDRQKDHLHVRFIKESRLPPEMRTNCVIVLNRYAFYATIKTWVPRGTVVGRSMEGEELKLFARRDEVEKATELAETVLKLSEEYK
jgi:hypothetical protein